MGRPQIVIVIVVVVVVVVDVVVVVVVVVVAVVVVVFVAVFVAVFVVVVVVAVVMVMVVVVVQTHLCVWVVGRHCFCYLPHFGARDSADNKQYQEGVVTGARFAHSHEQAEKQKE